MTNEELTKKLFEKFGRCPKCGGDNLSAGDWDGSRIVSCAVNCDDCDSSWREYYKFMGAEDFDEG